MFEPMRSMEQVSRECRWSRAEAEVVVEAFARSGLDLTDFARRWRIRASRLQRWVERIDGDTQLPTPITFHPVIVTHDDTCDPTPPHHTQPHKPLFVAELTRRDWTLRVPAHFDDHDLRRLLLLLEEVSP